MNSKLHTFLIPLMAASVLTLGWLASAGSPTVAADAMLLPSASAMSGSVLSGALLDRAPALGPQVEGVPQQLALGQAQVDLADRLGPLGDSTATQTSRSSSNSRRMRRSMAMPFFSFAPRG